MDKVLICKEIDGVVRTVAIPATVAPAWCAEGWELAANKLEPLDGEPSRSGSGSGVAAWSDYAKSLGIGVLDDATRDEVIASVDAYNLANAGPVIVANAHVSAEEELATAEAASAEATELAVASIKNSAARHELAATETASADAVETATTNKEKKS